eukprot:TRINITY_DN12235_c0_g4_i2.p1 TRINITY_DN12235_c0_g4~~TRINITY_DN12235_c0_g4_i2.p1  ORF type:complete len:194 (-),score=12.77 TRINITY_DN12235_c0_g4_i2:156-656(-)
MADTEQQSRSNATFIIFFFSFLHTHTEISCHRKINGRVVFFFGELRVSKSSFFFVCFFLPAFFFGSFFFFHSMEDVAENHTSLAPSILFGWGVRSFGVSFSSLFFPSYSSPFLFFCPKIPTFLFDGREEAICCFVSLEKRKAKQNKKEGEKEQIKETSGEGGGARV